MTALSLLLLPLLAVAATGGRWLALNDASGAFLTLLEVAPREEHWLRPACALIRGLVSDECGASPQLELRLRLWTDEALIGAKRALHADGYCGPADPCRVLPFQALRLAVKDQRGVWASPTPWTFVAGPLPAHKDFRLRRQTPAAARQPNCTDSGPRPLSPAETAALDSLFVELIGASQPPSAAPETLTVSAEDVSWAAGRLGLTITRSRPSLVDRRALRQLAEGLLRSRRAYLASFGRPAPLPASAGLVRRLQMALAARGAAYSSDLGPMLAHKRRPRAGEMVYVLNTAGAAVPLPEPGPAPRARLHISVALPAAVNATEADSRTTTQRLERALLQHGARIQALQAQLANTTDALTRTVRALANTTAGLDGDVGVVLRLHNISRSRGGAAGLVPVAHCGEVRRRRLARGVYVLAAASRPVLCTESGELVVLRRAKGDTDFARNWTAYVEGFGDPRTGADFWIGLRLLAALTQSGDRCMALRIRPRGAGRPLRTATYSDFSVGPAADGFPLRYGAFGGDLDFDALRTSRGRPFSTPDRDNDLFPGSCASIFGAGGWFASCHDANVFGPMARPSGAAHRARRGAEGLCWSGLPQRDVCSPLAGVEMAVRRTSDGARRRELVLSLIGGCSTGSGCKSRLQEVRVNATAVYTISAGGGAGGSGHDGKYWKFGGRGATVRTTVTLSKGTRLALVVGCGGRYFSSGNARGSGGNGTWVVDRTGGRLLLVAGGGGGSANNVAGQHGRASEEASDAWFVNCHRTPTAARLLQRHFAGAGGGLGWTDVKDRLLGGETTGVVGTGGRYHGSSGGGGGGYTGGSPGSGDSHVPGGGGGSFCNDTAALSCSKEEGGNRYGHGYVLMEQHVCA